jgi:phosphohistidine phosphatase
VRLLVVRHAAAEDKDEFARTGRSDELRPLTAEGKRDMREAARGLRDVVPKIDVLATSPLVRAVETAEILGAAYDREHVIVEALRPESPYDDLARWARAHAKKDVVAIVGHEPHLSGLVSWLLAGAKTSFIDLKKGAACMLEIEGVPSSGSAMLLWSMAPRQLRAIGRR